MECENRARENRSHGRFRENAGRDKEKGTVGYVEGESADEDEICVAEWVDTPRQRPIACSFLRPGPGRDEMKYTFDVSKCDKLFDLLLQNKVIRLQGGHVIPAPEQLGNKKYCKWHNSYSHKTNDCN